MLPPGVSEFERAPLDGSTRAGEEGRPAPTAHRLYWSYPGEGREQHEGGAAWARSDQYGGAGAFDDRQTGRKCDPTQAADRVNFKNNSSKYLITGY